MRRFLMLVAAASFGAVSMASAQGKTGRTLGAARYAGQVVAGAGALPIGYVLGGITTRWVARRFGARRDQASDAGYMGAWAGAAVGTATAVSLIGARGPGHGSLPAAIGGATVGGLGSALIVHSLRRPDDAPQRPCRLGCIAASAVIALLPSAGATIAYDLSRR